MDARKNSRGAAPRSHPRTSDGPNSIEVLNGICAALKRNRVEYQKELRAQMAATYRIAWDLSRDPSLWTRFCRAKYWEDAGQPPQISPTDQADALRFVLRYVWGKGDAASKKASFYYRGMRKLVSDGVEPSLARDEIRKRGGFKNMAAAPAQGVKESKSYSTSLNEGSPKENSRPALNKIFGHKITANSDKIKSGKKHGGPVRVTFEAELSKKISLSNIPTGCDFTLRGTLKHLGPPIVVQVRQLVRDS